MFLYIDALFRAKSGSPLASSEAGGFLTTDYRGIRCIPPFMLEPTTIMVVTSGSDVTVFDDEDLASRLANFGEFMESAPLTGYEACVGWYLDQVIIPAICANSVITGTRSVTRWMRGLNEKWSKTLAFSVERAFWQGWYPSEREMCNDGRLDLTLDMAMSMAGLPNEKIVDEGLKPEHALLLTRLAAINKLYNRCMKVATKE